MSRFHKQPEPEPPPTVNVTFSLTMRCKTKYEARDNYRKADFEGLEAYRRNELGLHLPKDIFDRIQIGTVIVVNCSVQSLPIEIEGHPALEIE